MKFRFMIVVVVVLVIDELTQIYYNYKQVIRMTEDKLDVFANTVEVSLHDHLKHIEERYSEFTAHYQNSMKVKQFM